MPRDMRIAAGDAELVVGSCLAETDELKSRIGIEVNEAAVGRARRNAAEDADAPVIAFGNASGSPRSIAPQLRRPRPTAPSFQPGPRNASAIRAFASVNQERQQCPFPCRHIFSGLEPW